MITAPGTPGSYDRRTEIARLEGDWAENPRWGNVTRAYSAEDVVRLRGSIKRDNTIAKLGAQKLWTLLSATHSCVSAQGVLTGGEAVQQIKAGAEAIYLSGGQTVIDQTTAETIRPDQSLYAINSIPSLVRRINNACERADQIQWKADAIPSDSTFVDYFAPIIADAEAHTGGALNAYELMKNMIRAGAAGVHFDDQVDSTKQRKHMSKVLMPTCEVVQKLNAARLAADVEDVPTLIMAHTTANATDLLSSDCDPYDQPFINGERTEEGFHRVRMGIEQAIARGLAYAPYADLLCLGSVQPDLEEARQFAEAIRCKYPDQLLAYNCASLGDLNTAEVEQIQRELTTMGYQFQFFAQTKAHTLSNAHEDLAA
jgi:isocitrate lyase